MDSSGSALSPILFVGVLFLGLYLLAIRPQRARLKALRQLQASVEQGSQVITTAGIHATVIELVGDQALLEVAPGVQIRFARAAIVRLVDQPGAAEDQPGAAEDQPGDPSDPRGPAA